MNHLSHDQLRKLAPSIFADGGSAKTTDKYSHISTIQVIDALANEGYVPVSAMQSRSRSEEKKGFAKHCVRFRHVNTVPVLNGGLFPELILTNSHDGLSSYKLQSGLYRLVCSNGMVSGQNHREIRVRHQGDIVGNVIDGTYEVMKQGDKLLDAAENMGLIILSQDEKMLFAQAVHEIYFDDDKSPLVDAIKPEQFLRARRKQDIQDDLFTTFNRAQENVIRGGLKGYYRDAKRGFVNTSTREVKSIDRNNALNRALWTLAEKMQELKKSS